MELFTRSIVLPDPTIKMETLQQLIKLAYTEGMSQGIKIRRDTESGTKTYTKEDVAEIADNYTNRFIVEQLNLTPYTL